MFVNCRWNIVNLFPCNLLGPSFLPFFQIFYALFFFLHCAIRSCRDDKLTVHIFGCHSLFPQNKSYKKLLFAHSHWFSGYLWQSYILTFSSCGCKAIYWRVFCQWNVCWGCSGDAKIKPCFLCDSGVKFFCPHFPLSYWFQNDWVDELLFLQ